MTSTLKPRSIQEGFHAIGGLDVGTGSNRGTISQILVGSKAVAQTAVSSIAFATADITVTGAATTDFCMVSISSIQGTIGQVTGKIVAANTVRAEVTAAGQSGALLATVASDTVLHAVVIKVS